MLAFGWIRPSSYFIWVDKAPVSELDLSTIQKQLTLNILD